MFHCTAAARRVMVVYSTSGNRGLLHQNLYDRWVKYREEDTARPSTLISLRLSWKVQEICKWSQSSDTKQAHEVPMEKTRKKGADARKITNEVSCHVMRRHVSKRRGGQASGQVSCVQCATCAQIDYLWERWFHKVLAALEGGKMCSIGQLYRLAQGSNDQCTGFGMVGL